MTFPITMVLRCSVAYMEQSVEMNLTALKAVSKSDGMVCGRSEVSSGRTRLSTTRVDIIDGLWQGQPGN